MSRLLAAHAKEIVGVDVSQGMVDEFNKHVEEKGISPKAVHAVRAELKGEKDELDGKKFDIIMVRRIIGGSPVQMLTLNQCTQGYHHIADVRTVTKTLAFFLKPGGKLVVIDMMPHDGNDFLHTDTHYMSAAHTVSHKHGFTESEMEGILEEAGLTGITLIPSVAHITYEEKGISLFIAHGIKPE
jgi:ubiquinone/menaquinone biosynthesis C-methylase UbiE